LLVCFALFWPFPFLSFGFFLPPKGSPGMRPPFSCIRLFYWLLKKLRNENRPFDDGLKVGAMIEVPSAALTADLLAKEADFFSIGTNDLIQYAIAADRSNEKIAYLYEPAHPGVLRLIKIIIDAGHKNGIWVGMCGEMAGEPALALLLLGLGLDEFSMPPIAVQKIKQLIRSVTYKEAQEVARTALGLSTGKEVEDFVTERLQKLVPELLL